MVIGLDVSTCHSDIGNTIAMSSAYTSTSALSYFQSPQCGLQLGDHLSYSFANGILDGDVLLISDNGQLKAHKCILSYSPILRSVFENDDLTSPCYDRHLATVYLPSFNILSLKAVLQFLYTGEVELVTGSTTTAEFSELCKVLKINPPVNKYRNYIPTKRNRSKHRRRDLDENANNQQNGEVGVNKGKRTVGHNETGSNPSSSTTKLQLSNISATPMKRPNFSGSEVVSSLQCDICGKTFDVQSKLRFHQKIRHDKEYKKCSNQPDKKPEGTNKMAEEKGSNNGRDGTSVVKDICNEKRNDLLPKIEKGTLDADHQNNGGDGCTGQSATNIKDDMCMSRSLVICDGNNAEDTTIDNEMIGSQIKHIEPLDNGELEDANEFKMPDNFDLPDDFLPSLNNSYEDVLAPNEETNVAIGYIGSSTVLTSPVVSDIIEEDLRPSTSINKSHPQSSSDIYFTDPLEENVTRKQHKHKQAVSLRKETAKSNDHLVKRPSKEHLVKNIMSNIESCAVTSKHLPPIWDSQGPTDLLEKAISCPKNRNSTNKIDDLPKKDSNGIKKYKSASEDLTEKRLRIVQKFRREEETKFDEQDKGKTGRLRQLNQSKSHSKSSRNNSFTKRRPKPNPTSDPDHICSSSCPANHWMSDDEGWIEKDVVSDEDTQWFPDFSSDSSITTESGDDGKCFTGSSSDTKENRSISKRRTMRRKRKFKRNPGNISTGKRLKLMKLESSFCTSGSDDTDDYENTVGRERTSPHKPRKIRMLERHRHAMSSSSKVSVSVQLVEVEDIMELSYYLSNVIAAETEDNTSLDSNIKASSLNKAKSTPIINEKKFRRIKLLDDSSSSSSEMDSLNTFNPVIVDIISEYNEHDNLSGKYISENSQLSNPPGKIESNQPHESLNGDNAKNGNIIKDVIKVCNYHPSENQKGSSNESHHPSSSKEHNHSTQFLKKVDGVQRMHSAPSICKSPKLDPRPNPQKLTYESSTALQFTCGLSYENKFLAERTKEKGNEGLNQIMKMNFKRKNSKQLDESEKSEIQINKNYSQENESG